MVANENKFHLYFNFDNFTGFTFINIITMKRFLLFAFSDFHSEAKLKDLVDSFDTLDEIIENRIIIKNNNESSKYKILSRKNGISNGSYLEYDNFQVLDQYTEQFIDLAKLIK